MKMVSRFHRSFTCVGANTHLQLIPKVSALLILTDHGGCCRRVAGDRLTTQGEFPLQRQCENGVGIPTPFWERAELDTPRLPSKRSGNSRSVLRAGRVGHPPRLPSKRSGKSRSVLKVAPGRPNSSETF